MSAFETTLSFRIIGQFEIQIVPELTCVPTLNFFEALPIETCTIQSKVKLINCTFRVLDRAVFHSEHEADLCAVSSAVRKVVSNEIISKWSKMILDEQTFGTTYNLLRDAHSAIHELLFFTTSLVAVLLTVIGQQLSDFGVIFRSQSARLALICMVTVCFACDFANCLLV
ncbi:hypothetical protein OA238_c17560 [Octadecabacter arcticus 238]|uniref:Uncharacterized protein n=1 Tax=Octadecabacter arcticus 238 TaxID=391616 RepID=M9RQ05_9RHOB|nr:hypothetical protein OA238_c17560 [Octadecabacter arcticus 238]